MTNNLSVELKESSDHPSDVASFASAFMVPKEITGTLYDVHIGLCIYGRFPGIFAYQVQSSFNACGLLADGTWYKYGERFPTAQAAYEALLVCAQSWWGRDKEKIEIDV